MLYEVITGSGSLETLQDQKEIQPGRVTQIRQSMSGGEGDGALPGGDVVSAKGEKNTAASVRQRLLNLARIV